MFFFLWHQAKDEKQEIQRILVPCEKCGATIRGPIIRRTYSGVFLFIPYRFKRKFVICPVCGHRQKTNMIPENPND